MPRNKFLFLENIKILIFIFSSETYNHNDPIMSNDNNLLRWLNSYTELCVKYNLSRKCGI